MNILLDLDGVIFDTYGLIKTFGKEKSLCDYLGIAYIKNVGYSFNQDIWKWTRLWWEKIVKNNIPIARFDNVEWILSILEKKYDLTFFTGRPSFTEKYTLQALRSIIKKPRIFTIDSQTNAVYVKNKIQFVQTTRPHLVIEDDVDVVNGCLNKEYKAILYYSGELKNTPFTKAPICYDWPYLLETIKTELRRVQWAKKQQCFWL